MNKIKTLSATVSLFFAVAGTVFAQEGRSYEWEPNSSVNSERPRLDPGAHDREMILPGDFAVIGGERNRARKPPGEVDPGTSNSPAGNAGGE
jgi:hypothetical protein